MSQSEGTQKTALPWSQRPWSIIKRSGVGFLRHDVLSLAAALSFYTLLSFAPIIVIGVWIASTIGTGAQDALLGQIAALLGNEAKVAANAVIESSQKRPDLGTIAGIVGVITLVVGSTTMFAQLQASLNIIFEIPPRATNAVWIWIRSRILSLGVMVSFGFVLLVSLTVSTLLGFFLKNSGPVWDILNQVITAAVFAVLFTALFRYLPDRRIPWLYASRGGVVTAVLFASGKWAIGFYLARGDVGGAYGAAGSLAVLLVWVYYSGAIFFLGAEITKAWMDVRGVATKEWTVNEGGVERAA